MNERQSVATSVVVVNASAGGGWWLRGQLNWKPGSSKAGGSRLGKEANKKGRVVE